VARALNLAALHPLRLQFDVLSSHFASVLGFHRLVTLLVCIICCAAAEIIFVSYLTLRILLHLRDFST
jgi:hypothetical protein